ncbi:MAG: hypothetical protein CMB24_06950 [Euryarchaeota archaeon]|nr:hypothetical protein [Euryarchaeota archaeon]
MPMLVIVIAGILGTVPRILKNNDLIPYGSATISLAALGVAMVGHQAIIHLTDLGSFTALQFLVVTFLVYFFDSRGRFEWSTVTVFAAIGINLGMIAALFYNPELDTIFERADGGFVSTLNLQRQALGYIFFSYLMIFVLLGLLVAVLTRGILNPESEEGWFSNIKSSQSAWNKSTLPLQIALLVWILAHIGSLWHFDSVSMADKLGITSVDGYHGHFGFWAAFFTGMIAFIVAGMVAERWYTRAMLTGSMWSLYQVSSWYERGMWQAEQLDGTWGALIWLGITFFICVGIYMISTHEKWGGWSNREDHEMSGARKFWNAHWASIMVGMAFFFGIVIRMQWFVVPSMNAYGTGNWDMTGGSDPWYMKRVVDYIIANEAHLIVDSDRAYPLGGVNPRPPLFTWSIAIVSMLLEPMLGDDAVWYAMLGLPAVYGALTIFPIATIAKDHFGKSASVVAAWLISFMPAHVSHSTWALADHDAFVMLFISLGFMYWMKAVKFSGSERLTRTSSPRLSDIFASFGVVARERKAAMSFAILAGVSFGVASLGWKGFVVGPSILFLAYFAQVALNMFRRRDSTSINALFLTMLGVNLLMALPFYGHPQLDLIFDGTGLQPFLFVLGFSLVISYVTTGFRDKPWLLVLGTLTVIATIFFVLLWTLKQFDLSNAWDVLFTGSGYFTKTKIFGTVAEANAPDRGQLFAQLGPIVLVLALTMGFYSLWSALRNRNQTHLVFGIWIFAATYMAWTAARFMFNATPAVAVLGAWGITSLWRRANWEGLLKTWKKFGIRTPADRITGARKAVWRTPSFSAILLIFVLLGGQQFTYGLDAAIPSSVEAEDELDETIFNIIPDALRWELAGFSVLDSSSYSGNWYLGSFGSGFNDQGWNGAYEWLANQDTQDKFSERPAFISWWDYGFQALDTGEHPSVSDNFQSGIPASGNMLLARSQDDLISMFIWQLAQGDLSYSSSNGDGYELTNGFENIVDSHLGDEQFALFKTSQEEDDFDKMEDMIDDYSFKVIQTNRDIVMAEGHHRIDGIADTSSDFWRIYQDSQRLLCDPIVSTSCVDGDWSNFDDANLTFNSEVRSGQESTYDTTHYIFGEYWYTSDLKEEFSSVSTHIHRKNTRLALAVQLLSDSLDSDGITNLYHDLIGMEKYYSVQDYQGLPGETIDRDHEIRYFAIDNRLYPRAGRYTDDFSYNQGQPMGIFGAPTILSGQDVSTFMNEVYETTRGGIPQEMTREQVDEAMTDDFLDQQAGLDIDPLQIDDVRVDHNPQFFDTMLSRAYVGYGASTLGVDSGQNNPQPSQHFGQSGTPGSYLQQALPMPGAMMNHFVIANWYNEDNNFSFGQANTYVKILKYYSGAEVSGQVTMEDTDSPLSGVRLLVERDAFSGEGAEDLDNDTYWIPIGFTDADDQGQWSFTAPAGKIRVSAFTGNMNLTVAQNAIQDGSFAQNLNDVLVDVNEDRTVNEITAVLGNVANMTWLGEVQLNVTGEQANRTELVTQTMDIEVSSSGISGSFTWSGDELFDGDALVDTDIVLKSTFGTSDDVTITTTNGSFSSDETRILQGKGEVKFTENGTFVSEGIASAIDFTGMFTRTINDGRTFVANGTWDGSGTIKATWIDTDTSQVPDCAVDSNNSENITMPVNQSICIMDESGDFPIYMIDGEYDADGRFTSTGVSVLSQEHQLSSFEGIGTFEGTGTLNGTGLFTGSGDFSGEMVNPGSFYKTGLVPGDYEVYAIFDNGREVMLPDIISVGLNPSYDLELSIPGTVLRGNITDVNGNNYSNTSFEITDMELGESSTNNVYTNSTGGYYFGPVSTGEYQFRIDIDSDGFYEINETVSIDSETTSLQPIGVIPEMFDVSIQFVSPVDESTSQPLFTVSNRTVQLTSENSSSPTSYTTDENGVINIELIPGKYQLDDSNSDNFVLFDSFDLSDDLNFTAEYSIASTVSGFLKVCTSLVLADCQSGLENATTTPGTGVPMIVSSASDDLQFSTTTITDNDGFYSLTLPANLDFQIIAQSTGNFGANHYFSIDNSTTYNVTDLYLTELRYVEGSLLVYDNVTQWSSFSFNEYVPAVVVENQDGVIWETLIASNGIFGFSLPDGDYTFTLEDSNLNGTQLLNHVVSDNSSTHVIELMANPSSRNVTFNVYLDVLGNQSAEAGIAVSTDFSLTSILDDDLMFNVTSDDFDSTGNITLELKPGKYIVSFNSTSATDDNASDFNNFYISEQLFVEFEDSTEQMIEFFLSNERLVTGNIKDHVGNPLNIEFLLYNEDENDWFSLLSDIDGEFSSYVPAGDWVVIVAPIIDGNNTTILRQELIVGEDSSLRTNLDLQLVNASTIEFQLLEQLTEAPIVNSRIIAVSNDGYGNITLSQSNESGHVSDVLMPGEWSLFLESENSTDRWYFNTSSNPFSTIGSENDTTNLGVQYAQLEVLIGGNIFWDYNFDNVSDPGEWVSDVNITVKGLNNSEVNETITTDLDGNWNLFVPIRDIYNISVEKEGYESIFYDINNVSGFTVHDDTVFYDIEIVANNVAVSGIITTNLPNSELQLNGSSITLYPSDLYDREPINVEGIYSDNTLSWNDVIAPGEWIVVVESPNLDDNGGGVSIGYLDATIGNGAVLEMEMVAGGWVEISTKWEDINLVEHHTGSSDSGYSMIESEVEISFDLSLGAKWKSVVDSDGKVTALMPIGSVILESDFTTTQHDRNLSILYTFISSQTVEQGILDVEIDYSRKINSKTSLSIDDSSITNASYTIGTELTAIQDGEEYKIIEFEIDSVYEGTESSDVFTVSGSVELNQDSSLWSVEFFNGTDWVSTIKTTMGVGESLQDNSVSNVSTIKARILMPNTTSSWSFDGGHDITVSLDNEGGVSSTLFMNVAIPQTYGLEITDAVEETGVSPGSTATFSFMLTNTGNGDDTFNVELSNEIPDGWQITPSSSTVTISKGDSRNQQFTVFAPSDFTSGEIEAWISVASEDGITNTTVEVDIKSARIDLSIDKSTINEKSFIYEIGGGQLIIPVENTGYRSAGIVNVTAKMTDNSGNVLESYGTQTISVGSGQTVEATFDINETSIKEPRFLVTVEIGDDSTFVADGGDIEPFDFIVPVTLETIEEDSAWLMVIIFVLAILVAYGGLKVARNKSSARF